MTYYLAETLGRTVDELEESMSSAEFHGWLAYFAEKNARERKAYADARARARRH